MAERVPYFHANWATGVHKFRLPVPQIEELQRLCDCGIGAMLGRLTQQRWSHADIRETIRLGLIGGDMPPAKALALVQRYIDDRPLGENANLALLIVMAAIHGVDAEAAESPLDTWDSESPEQSAIEQPNDEPAAE